MHSGKESKDSRFVVIGDGQVLFSCEDRVDLERYIQGKNPNNIAIFQKRYMVEGVLCSVGYEDEMSDNPTEAGE